MLRAGDFAAITLWWDVAFCSPHHKRDADADTASVVLSTSPRSPPTHWMQLSVLLGDFFPVPVGATLDGVTVTLAAAEDNPRFFTFSVET